MATTGAELAEWCTQHSVPGFAGVFCADDVPVLFQPSDFCAIVNHSPCASPTGGTHWVGVRIRRHKAWWFDSYGLPPHATIENQMMSARHDPPPRFTAWLQRCGVTQIFYNAVDIQSIASAVCGLYAAYFCLHGLPSENKVAWSFLTRDVERNDAEIRLRVRITD